MRGAAMIFDLLDSVAASRVVLVRDRASGLRAVIVIDSTELGPAVGGIRTFRYASDAEALADAAALAKTMTLKCAIAGLPCGGGKGVVLDGPELDRPRAFAALGDAIESLRGAFLTGGDLGTTEEDVRTMSRRTRYAHAEGAELDVSGSTARGVVIALEAAARHAGLGERPGSAPLAGLEVVVQGVGAVGGRIAERLAQAGARLMICDVDGVRAAEVAQRTGARVIPPSDATRTRCDAFVPCAKGEIVDRAVASSLPCRVICGAANNPIVDDGAFEELERRGVVVVPDFVASAGGVIEGIGASVLGLADRTPLLEAIGATVSTVLGRAAATGRGTYEIAREIARERIAARANG
jgi:leucine dehydrogenase